MRILIGLIFSFLTNIIFAQEWIDKWEDPNSNFYEILQGYRPRRTGQPS